MHSEPSVEEILASIKKVIDRENRESALAERRRRETAGLVREIAAEVAPESLLAAKSAPAIALAATTESDEAEGEVLELGDAATAMIDEDEVPAPAIEAEASGTMEAENILDTIEHAVDFSHVEEEDGAMADDEESGLTREENVQSVRQSLDALASLAASAQEEADAGRVSLGETVREMLRPMLAEWLDENLPQIVERMVQAEIARIAGLKP